MKECIEAGSIEFNELLQQKILKAASYGKTFLNASQIDHNSLHETCRYLRVVNNLRKSRGLRTMTLLQVKTINELQFVKILLRYNLHYIALKICEHLGFQDKNKLIPMIYEHWACCKIEQDLDEVVLCSIIKEKLQNVKGISFTDIAQKAINLYKNELGLRLLDNEPSISKRIPILLDMAEKNKTVENVSRETERKMR